MINMILNLYYTAYCIVLLFYFNDYVLITSVYRLYSSS